MSFVLIENMFPVASDMYKITSYEWLRIVTSRTKTRIVTLTEFHSKPRLLLLQRLIKSSDHLIFVRTKIAKYSY